MTERTVLVPSQAIRRQSSASSKKKNLLESAVFLVPSQVPGSVRNNRDIASSPGSSGNFENDKNMQGKKKKNNRKTKGNQGQKEKDTSSNRLRRHGNIPDIEWRAVPMEHLRQHPNFVPLPLPETIKQLDELEDVRSFRQESWQWDAIHEGRCTTSQAVAALGFLEPQAGSILGVPRSWRRGGMGAYHRLREPAIRSLEEMSSILCNAEMSQKTTTRLAADDDSRTMWKQFPESSTAAKFPFAAKYMVPIDDAERQRRKQHMKDHHLKAHGFDFTVRMHWGDVQEATALLTGLNYFAQESDNQVQLHEVGMCGAGIELEDSSLLLGATPDGLLYHPDGRIEVLEVKNHCPFLPSRNWNNNNNRSQSRFVLKSYDFHSHQSSVLPHYVPQLMLEMLCVGPECRSAIMVRQSATSGALVLRVQRDDAWIEEMIYWLKKFLSDYVEPGIPPPDNFFLQHYSDVDQARRYKRFLEWTKELESNLHC